jgi:hypothetical protein
MTVPPQHFRQRYGLCEVPSPLSLNYKEEFHILYLILNFAAKVQFLLYMSTVFISFLATRFLWQSVWREVLIFISHAWYSRNFHVTLRLHYKIF